MSEVNVEMIINGTPTKRIINGYNKMKENFTEASAQEFYDIYRKEPLSAILENSRMIFSEPYYGLKFYLETVGDISLCIFNSIEEELSKVQEFVESNGSKMSSTQKEKYETLLESMKDIYNNTVNTRIFADYVKEEVNENFESKLSNLLYEAKTSESLNKEEFDIVIESLGNDPVAYLTYAPYIYEATQDRGFFGEATKIIATRDDIEGSLDDWKLHVEKVVAASKLSLDNVYTEACNKIGKMDRVVFEVFMNHPINNDIDHFMTEVYNENEVVHATAESAVNSIFDDIEEISFTESNDTELINAYKNIAYEAEMNVLIREYQICESTDVIAKGYSLLPEERMTLEAGYEYFNNLIIPDESVITESEDDDLDDDGGKDTGKKPQAPKAKNLATKIQFKAMDAESKQMRRKSELAKKGQEIGGAIKAVTALPLNVITDIKKQIRKVDEADDNRRKNYLTEPGFRKKAFKNLKLAILYGSAANVKLSLVPVVAICRHYSKMKDRRMQNELVREINTEIKICEEKINDANANNDMKEKYRLIRIKDQLDAELVRVKTNSKFV